MRNNIFFQGFFTFLENGNIFYFFQVAYGSQPNILAVCGQASLKQFCGLIFGVIFSAHLLYILRVERKSPGLL